MHCTMVTAASYLVNMASCSEFYVVNGSNKQYHKIISSNEIDTVCML